MNHDEHALSRLLRSARRISASAPEAMPFTLEARILARWRSGMPEEDLAWLAGVFRRAVICAGVVMILSLGWSQLSAAREVPGATTLTRLEQAIPVEP